MHHNPYFEQSLHVFCADFGSFASLTLGTSVSPLSLEVMKAICVADGIQAFSALRYVPGKISPGPAMYTEEATHPFWNTVPGLTLLAKLGLCRSGEKPASLNYDLRGSPLYHAIMAILDCLPRNLFNQKLDYYSPDSVYLNPKDSDEYTEYDIMEAKKVLMKMLGKTSVDSVYLASVI